MKIHSKKHMKLFSALVIGGVSLFALSGCNSEARYSEHLEWDGTLTQEESKVEDSVTIKFSLTYDSAAQDASNWATLYAQGSWNATEPDGGWGEPEALTWNSSSQTYDLTLENVTHGTYECQLLFGYNHLETYDWEYRITQDGENLSFTVDSSAVTVPVTLDKEVTSIIPEYKAELSGYTLSFTFKYGESTAAVPSYASVYIAGSWDNEGDQWETFHALTPGDNNTYTYSISDIVLKAGETYTYGLVLVYSGDTPSWTYEVKTSSDKYIYIYGTEGDNHIESIEIVLTEEFSTTIPEPINNYTLTISISYDGNTEYIPEYVDLYISGDFNEWSETDKITSINEDRQSFTYTIETVHVGTEYKYQLIAVESGEGYSSSNALSISGESWINSSFTVSSGDSSQTIVFAATRSISSLVTDPNLESYTVVIKLLNHNGTASIGAPTDEYKLFINSAYDASGDDWGTHQLTYNDTDDTYSYSYSAKPSTAGNYETSIYAGTSSEDCWSNKLATFNITSSGEEEKVHTYDTISITTAYDSISDIFTSSTYTVTIGDLGQAPERIQLYVAGDFNGYYDATGTDWQGFSWGDEVSLTPNEDEATYNLSLSFTPAVGSSIELIGYDSETEETGSEWNHPNIATYTFTGNESGSFTMTTTHSAWSEVFTGLAENTTDFYIVILNTDSTGSSSLISKVNYIKTESSDGSTYWNSETIFNGSDTSSLTSATTGGGQDCVYNSVPGTAIPGTGHAAYVYDDGITPNSSWNNEFHVNLYSGSEVPKTGNDEYAVYLCGIDGSGSFSSKPSVSTTFSDGSSGGWVVVKTSEYTTIADYVAALEYRGLQGGTSGEVGDTTSFYFLGLSESNTITETTMSVETTSWGTESIFNGSTSCSLTTGTNLFTSDSKTYAYCYNSTVGVANKNSTHLMTIYSINSESAWENQITISSVTIPETYTGTIAVYVYAFDSSNSNYGTWENFSFSNGVTSGWNTNYRGTIEQFVSSLSGASMSWSS